MRKKLWLLSGVGILLAGMYFLNPFRSVERVGEEGEEDEYENLQDRYSQEFEQLKDPATGGVPNNRLLQANEFTQEQKRKGASSRVAGLNWQERGPVYDFVGPSNGNTRGGAGGYTAGIVQTALVDLGNDPTGNTVFAGSPSGGLWRCTNFLATVPPNWVAINDFQANLAIASICQNPTTPGTMYLATGDGNTRDVTGYGVWKSTNAGLTWTVLPSTVTFKTAFKIVCDLSGTIYLATGGGGLKRSNDGGTTWTTISPAGLTASNASYVTDIELTSTGRLHGAFGYFGTKVQHAYTDVPASVTSASGWTFSTGIRRASSVSCSRIEMAAQGDILYAVTANSAYNIDSCYKSTDGGANWTLQNTTAYPTGLGSGQAWYATTLQINPDNPSEFIAGGLDAYRSVNDGLTVQRITYWVTTAPYVHADHHFMQWYKVGAQSRVIIGCDGGITQSTDAGVTWTDRNQNLGIKQFYSCAISPTAGVNFLFAGAQDNGCHQLTQPGLGFSTEVTGGDGAYVYINQQNPQIQFGSYIYNQYRRSTNGGTSWSSINLSGSTGYFINPFEYDDAKNIMYASNASGSGNNQIRRWDNANTSGATGSTVFTISELVRSGSNSNASSFKVSPYTPDRVFIGGSTGKILRLDSASTVTSSATITSNITDLTSASFPTGYINCVNTGTSDNNLVATFTNYGVNNVWVSSNGGTTWTAVDGTTGAGGLPDMPVWWAVFVPGDNSKLIIGTETGVFSTDALNGASTVWTADASFPTVRTRMLRIRASDNTIVAATYGRGLWTATITGACVLPGISSQPAGQTICAGSNASFSVTAPGTGLTYQWRKNGTAIPGATTAAYSITAATATDGAIYDVVITNSCGTVTSAQAALTVNAATAISSQPSSQTVCAGTSVVLSVTASGGGLTYQWRKGGVTIPGANTISYAIASAAAADAGSYDVVVTGSCGTVTSSAAVVTVNAATVITTQPVAQSVCAGTAASFSVAGTGNGTVSYQWRKNGVNITGATTSSYTIASTAVADGGNYDVIVTAGCGPVTSTAVTLAVNTGGGCVTAIPNVDPDVTNLMLLPNMVQENTVLRIKVQRPMTVNWTVTDAKGSVAMSFVQKLSSGQTDKPLQFSHLARGSYFLTGTTDKGKLGVLRFQKL